MSTKTFLSVCISMSETVNKSQVVECSHVIFIPTGNIARQVNSLAVHFLDSSH